LIYNIISTISSIRIDPANPQEDNSIQHYINTLLTNSTACFIIRQQLKKTYFVGIKVPGKESYTHWKLNGRQRKDFEKSEDKLPWNPVKLELTECIRGGSFFLIS
jgi:hypothetical protein